VRVTRKTVRPREKIKLHMGVPAGENRLKKEKNRLIVSAKPITQEGLQMPIWGMVECLSRGQECGPVGGGGDEEASIGSSAVLGGMSPKSG